jgi:hypothetical protein
VNERGRQQRKNTHAHTQEPHEPHTAAGAVEAAR